ncbi:MAG: hypothetical protein HY735_16050 [Verrucomicrobia bacterium]|nr:hypothetical protein [Verrucomicrobiota bacterium]
MKTFMASSPILASALLVFNVATATQARAAVANAAWLQGSLLEDGSRELNSATPKAIQWMQKSSIDPRLFDHSLNDPTKLIVKQDGDFLVAATLPVISLDTSDNRPTQAIEVYVNGQPAPGAVSQSSYIRNMPTGANMHQESSDHIHCLLKGLKAKDVIELKVHKTTVPAVITAIQTASLYVEMVAPSRTVFAGLSSGPTQGTSLNADTAAGENPADLAWTSTRKDAGFTHSNGSANISLSVGTYLVFVNVPVRATVARAAPGLEVALNGQIVPGGRARQGYIRNSQSHTLTSLHWAGLVQVTGNQMLTLRTTRTGAAGAVTIQPGKEASVYIEKLDGSSGVLFTKAVSVDDPTSPTNWNPPAKTAIVWETPDFVGDNNAFNRGGSKSQIQIRQAGNYLLVYNDTLQSSATRSSPRITVEVNRAVVPGAETKTHYIRNTDGHNTSSAALVFLLEGLAANDVVTVSTQAEGNTGDVVMEETSTEAAILGLIRKETLVLPPGDRTPPRIVYFSGDLFGFEMRIQDFGLEVSTASVKILHNGQSIPVQTSKAGGVTTVKHSFAEFPASGSTQTIAVSFGDTATPAGTHQAEFGYLITAQYTVIPPAFLATGVDTTKPGFLANITQVSTAQSGAGSLHGNTIVNAEKQLAGGYIDAATGQPYYNEADPTAGPGKRWSIPSVEVPTVINWEQDAGSAGNFTAANGFQDSAIPNIPGSAGIADGMVVEILTFLELKAGFQTLGVNSDDGFKVTSGPSPKDQLAATPGLYNAGRAAGDTLFDVLVKQDGIYPFRLLWFEGTGGASVEFFSVHQGQKILINDRSNPNAIKAYRAAKTRPYISMFGPASGTVSKTVEFEVTDGDVQVVASSIKLSIDGQDKTAAAKASKTGAVTKVSFDNGDYFAGGVRTAVLSYDESSAPVVNRTITHTFKVPFGQSAVLLDSPVAYWRFGESSGNQALSEVGTGLTATYFGGPTLGAERLVAGDVSTAVLFDKSKTQWLDIPDHAEINDSPSNPGWKEKSIEMWFKARNLPTSKSPVAGVTIPDRQVLYEQGGATRGMNIYLSGTEAQNPTKAELWFNLLNRAEQAWGGTLPVDQGLTPNGDPLAVKTTIEANKTYHIVLVMSGDNSAVDSFQGKLIGYINGEKFGETTGVHLLYDHTDDVGIAARNEEVAFHDHIVNNAATSSPLISAANEMFFFDGWIDEVALYNTALSEARIKAHYQAGITAVPGPGGGSPKISLKLGTAGAIQIEFEGTLQSAEDITGPWTDVAGGSPQTITLGPAAPKKFFRSRR